MSKKIKKKQIEIAENASITEILEVVRKQHGEASIMMFNEGVLRDVPVIPTGSPKLDMALGIGGLPKGRIVEVIGPESSGKTTLTLHVVANAQKAGENCAFIDVEHSLDPSYAESLGVDLDRLLISQPDCGEDALDLVETLINTKQVGVIVIDSVAALVPRAELEGHFGDVHMGLQARMMSQAMRKLTAITRKAGTLLLFTNQIRFKIGVLFGSPETTSGGNALKFYSSVRLDIRRISQEKDGDNVVAIKVRTRVIKNKMAPPFKIAESRINFGQGFDAVDDIFDLCVDYNLIEQSGAWYSYDGVQLGQGKEKAKEALVEQGQDFIDNLYNYVIKENKISKLRKQAHKYKKGDAKRKKLMAQIKELKGKE